MLVIFMESTKLTQTTRISSPLRPSALEYGEPRFLLKAVGMSKKMSDILPV